MSPALPIPEHEKRALREAIAYDETPARTGYQDARAVFAGALAAVRLAGPSAPTTLEGLSAVVEEHAGRAAFGGVAFDARETWRQRVCAVRLAQPSVMRRRGYAALAELARGCV